MLKNKKCFMNRLFFSGSLIFSLFVLFFLFLLPGKSNLEFLNHQDQIFFRGGTDFFADFFKGIAIGAGAILPGISSGVLCVIFGISNNSTNSQEFVWIDFN